MRAARRVVVDVNEKLVLWGVWISIGVLLVGNVAYQLTDHLDYVGAFLAKQMFDLIAESSAGTWVSAVLFFVSGALVLLAGALERGKQSGQRRRWAWILVSVLLFGISFDEVASVHETTSFFIREGLGLDGILYYAWIVPAFVLVVVAALLLVPWLRSLPRWLGTCVVVAAGLFSIGTFGFELIEGYLESRGLSQSSDFILAASAEESLELVAVGVLFSGLLVHVARAQTDLNLRFSQLTRGVEEPISDAEMG